MSAPQTGALAEDAAAGYLIQRGYNVIERNYRTPRCEIDVIARKGNCIYFVEVKYRSRDAQGAGLEYVTNKKRAQMARAAEIWLQEHEWRGEVTLAAIEVAADFEVTEFIEAIA